MSWQDKVAAGFRAGSARAQQHQWVRASSREGSGQTLKYTPPYPKDTGLASPGQLQVDLSWDGAGLGSGPGAQALLALHLVSNNSQVILFWVLSQHKHPHTGSRCVHLITGCCRGWMAQTYPFPLPKQMEALKGTWNKKHLGDVSLELFPSVVISAALW